MESAVYLVVKHDAAFIIFHPQLGSAIFEEKWH